MKKSKKEERVGSEKKRSPEGKLTALNTKFHTGQREVFTLAKVNTGFHSECVVIRLLICKDTAVGIVPIHYVVTRHLNIQGIHSHIASTVVPRRRKSGQDWMNIRVGRPGAASTRGRVDRWWSGDRSREVV